MAAGRRSVAPNHGGFVGLPPNDVWQAQLESAVNASAMFALAEIDLDQVQV